MMKVKRLSAVLLFCVMACLIFVQCASCPLCSKGSPQACCSMVDGNSSASIAAIKPASEYYELRIYEMASDEKRQAYVRHLAEALIPALNRAGVEQVGVYLPMVEKTMTLDKENLNLYVLLVHKNPYSAITVSNRIVHDKALWEKGKPILNSEKKDPAYKRVETTLLGSFKGIPKLEAPEKKDSRVYQLRIYESHSMKKGKKKVQMFNEGEIALFRKTGMQPVFFGEALMGPRIPNLTYMITFEDIETKKANWKKFGQHPEWKAMSGDPQYKDTVSNISNFILKAADCSQI